MPTRYLLRLGNFQRFQRWERCDRARQTQISIDVADVCIRYVNYAARTVATNVSTSVLS
jgi:hypothetical protein